MRLMPDLEEDELAVIYEAKGLTPERARETAHAMMQDPTQALDAMVREELNIHPAELAPLKDGIVTGTATAVGAFIPIVPFLTMEFGERRLGRRSSSAWAPISRSAPRAACSPGRGAVGERPRHVPRRLRRRRRGLRDRGARHEVPVICRDHRPPRAVRVRGLLLPQRLHVGHDRPDLLFGQLVLEGRHLRAAAAVRRPCRTPRRRRCARRASGWSGPCPRGARGPRPDRRRARRRRGTSCTCP